MLGLCFGVIFLVVNGFAARSVLKVLRGSDGAFKIKVKHRFYPGSEDQAVDPLIASIDRREEKRLCNGTMRPVNLYRVTDDLDSAIHDYFTIGKGAS